MIIANELFASWKCNNGINNNHDISTWIESRKQELKVSIQQISLEECLGWKYDIDNGMICRNNRDFFAIAGLKQNIDNIILEQPIILQPEIGYLGIICKKIDGIVHFLMQAKIEPGNINTLQISPTIQATKSNFTQKHGGSKPTYLDFFLAAASENILVDQIQSEQSSRFWHKRNRNIIINIDENEDIEVLPSHMWMTLGQIKQLMKQDNLVNMDTRTVISCIPFSMMRDTPYSLSSNPDRAMIVELYNEINNYKMFKYTMPEIVDLFSLKNWKMKNDEFIGTEDSTFKIIFCDICIDGREVHHWCQPLFAAIRRALFGILIYRNKATNRLEILVHVTSEIGCFDGIEIGPTIQCEGFDENNIQNDELLVSFHQLMKDRNKVLIDVMLSEEGGRFYHEENRNVIIEVDKKDLPHSVHGYVWCDIVTLNYLSQINNCLNIQLRTLLSLLDYQDVILRMENNL